MPKKKDDEDFKQKTQAWVKKLKDLMESLAAYCKEFHKTGLVWNAKGIDIVDFKASIKFD